MTKDLLYVEVMQLTQDITSIVNKATKLEHKLNTRFMTLFKDNNLTPLQMLALGEQMVKLDRAIKALEEAFYVECD